MKMKIVEEKCKHRKCVRIAKISGYCEYCFHNGNNCFWCYPDENKRSQIRDS